MKVLPLTRWLWLVLLIPLLLTTNTAFAKDNNNTNATENKYDTRQLIRDVAILYRREKLEKRITDSWINNLATVNYITTNPGVNSKAALVSSLLNKQEKNKTKKKTPVKRLAKRNSKNRLKRRISKNKKRSKRTVARKRSDSYRNSMMVTATAYTSHVNQTDSTPNIAAWGDRLKPGMKVIAVSRDMLKKYGLKHRSKVRIKGLKGEYEVLDKMNRRWRKKIDIYMGKDLKKAFKWGRKRVELQWN